MTDNDYEIGTLEKTIDNLKAECEDWKNRSDGWMSKYEQEAALREFVNEQLDQEQADSEKFKRVLAEIKNIAEENIRIADLEGLNGVYRRGLAEQILQIIREVEE